MENVARELKKPVEAIQCSNTFGLLQRKMYNVLLANAAGHLRPEVTHRISIGTLCKLMGYKSRDYETIKNRFRELRRMDIEWDIINEKGNNVWTNTSPLSLARVIEGEGICEYEFTKSLLPYLDRPAQYAKFSLAVQAQFKSSYGLALYENCERYRKIGYTKAFDIPTFRKLMGLKDTEYLEFFAMKRRVIDKAIKEVNTYADFSIQPEYEKKGKNIVKIKFLIFLKVKREIEDIKILVKESKDDTLKNMLESIFDYDAESSAKLLKKYDEDYVKEKIDYILSTQTFKNGDIDNLSAYLISALANDYKRHRSSKEVIEEIKKEKQVKEDAQFFQQKKQKALDDVLWRYSRFVEKKLVEVVNNFNSEDLCVFKEAFSDYLKLKNDYDYSKFLSKGLISGSMFVYFKQFMLEKYPFIFDKIDSQDDFIKQNFPEVYCYYLELKNDNDRS